MRKILTIEGDYEQAIHVKRILAQARMMCVRAQTFEEGLDRARAEFFDCAIVGLDGDLKANLEAAARLHDLQLPVVFYTYCQDEEVVGAVRPTGAAFVLKGEGSDHLLKEKVCSQMNFRSADHETMAGQQDAQRRMMAHQPIEESTLVSLSLTRVVVIVAAIIAGTIGITTMVLRKVGEVDASVTSIRTSLEANTLAITRRQDLFEAELRQTGIDTQKRILEWSKWRWNVSRDIQAIGEGTKINVTTKTE